MAENKGRGITVNWKGANIAKVRTKSVAIANEPIDITGDTDDGWRTLLDSPGQKSVDISVSGVVTNRVLIKDAARDAMGGAVVMTWPDGGTMTGNFKLTSFTSTGEYNGAETFDATFQSSAEVEFDGGT